MRDEGRTEDRGKLVHLSESKRYDIPDGEPDVRGWTVRTQDGRKLGKVEDLLVDTGVGKIRYLEVELASEPKDETGRDYALIPVGAARVDEEEDNVLVSERAAEHAGLPRYDRERFSRDYERQIRTHYEGGLGGRSSAGDEDFYAHPAYDDRSFFGGRRRGRESEPYLRDRA